MQRWTATIPFVLLYTISGRDVPRGLPVPVRALACLEQHMLVGLDARDDDVYWNISDPGWAAGLYYAVIGPLLLAAPFCSATGRSMSRRSTACW